MKDRACEIAGNHGYGGYQRALASMVYKFFDKETESGVSVNKQWEKNYINQELKNLKEEKYIGDLKTIFGQQT